jgi:crossover junction endodeoxyribonuclease RuvC
MSANLSVTEYSPRKVKQSITGNGNADKEQVWKMVQRILLIENRPRHFDATDALAVAICHHFQSNGIMKLNGEKKKSLKKKPGWEEFIKQHPARVR